MAAKAFSRVWAETIAARLAPPPLALPLLVLPLLALPLLAACAPGAPPPQSASALVPTQPPAPAAPLRLALPGGSRVAEVHMAPGLEGVIGATAPELIAAFGPARLDVAEGDARKLQFSGPLCVLDVYLYPSDDRRDAPRATYVDARHADTGRDLDRAQCVTALRRPG